MKEIVKLIEIDYWIDPNTPLNLQVIGDEVLIFFKCLNKEFIKNGIHKNEQFVGLFHLKNVLDIRHKRYTKLQLYPIDFDHNFQGYFYEIQNSNWLKEIISFRDTQELNWEKYDKKTYNHYVFDNNKFWFEIIAEKIEVHKIRKKQDLLSKWKDVDSYIKKLQLV
ncbi:hypothetical protein [Flavobacterium oreochromis]|uniref:hypothetical protein n=1 Tax=Flavobacterium oreochromis TaxID=2906078 RepID=UPI001CE60998|nr:hypothetical protein [Flavobacterium oreochromis]QYS87232.1 hypothetical protein JJC03_04655 [Flavobacterium oreochromis]